MTYSGSSSVPRRGFLARLSAAAAGFATLATAPSGLRAEEWSPTGSANEEAFPSDVTVPALMRRGVVFIVCNVAVRTLSRRLTREGGDSEALYKELVAGVVPGTIVVPNLYVAMSHAQQKGVSYIFID